jgi:hypothetical protein
MKAVAATKSSVIVLNVMLNAVSCALSSIEQQTACRLVQNETQASAVADLLRRRWHDHGRRLDHPRLAASQRAEASAAAQRVRHDCGVVQRRRRLRQAARSRATPQRSHERSAKVWAWCSLQGQQTTAVGMSITHAAQHVTRMYQQHGICQRRPAHWRVQRGEPFQQAYTHCCDVSAAHLRRLLGSSSPCVAE